MALTIKTSLTGRIFYSYALNEIQLSTAEAYVRVQLKAKEQVVFSSTYYAVNGSVIVRNLSSLFESVIDYMGYPYLVFTIVANDEVDEVTQSFSILYCRDKIIDLPAGDFLDDYFVTTNLCRLTTIHNSEQLGLYLSGSSTYNNILLEISTVLRLPDGSIVDYTYTPTRRVGSGLVFFSISAAEVQEKARYTYSNSTLLFFKVTYGKRVCRFYVQPCPSAEVFEFKNNFGCMEYVAFPAVSTSKLESEFSEAKVNGQLSQYDVRHLRTYDVETPPLLANQMTWLEQFLTSNHILKIGSGLSEKILIKDYDFEQSNAPGAENKLSFTWQFADGRQTPYRVNLYPRSFTAQFNEMYT